MLTTFILLAIVLVTLYRAHVHYNLICRKCNTLVDMTGKTVIITGANGGIGKATAKEFAKRNATVILACRNISDGRKAANDIRRCTLKGHLRAYCLDLASMKSIDEFVKEFLKTETRLDILINNAAVLYDPRVKTEDGFEIHFGVNHLGHFYLTLLLLERMHETSTSGRIIIVSSYLSNNGVIHFKTINDAPQPSSWGFLKAYCNSKLSTILFCQELARRVSASHISTFCVSPTPLCYTNLYRNVLGKSYLCRFISMIMRIPLAIFAISPEQGCQTILHCALSPDLEKFDSGSYYEHCQKVDLIQNEEHLSEMLWTYSELCVRSYLLDYNLNELD